MSLTKTITRALRDLQAARTAHAQMHGQLKESQWLHDELFAQLREQRDETAALIAPPAIEGEWYGSDT